MVNMTPDFYNFFRNALEILGLKSWGLLTLCVFTVDVASVGRFPIAFVGVLRSHCSQLTKHVPYK